MDRYSTNAWQYDPRNPVRVLSQLPAELLFSQSPDKLLNELWTKGGKAFGLRVCERLATGSPRLRVPPWLALTPDTILSEVVPMEGWRLLHEAQQVKVRSSARTEDWLSGSSGEQQSRTIQDSERVYAHAREISRSRDPVVVQKYVEGIGLVVDIAHSPILGLPIVRISTGREQRLPSGKRMFTSATSDHEGRHEVIDPVTGTFLTGRVTGTLFEGSCLRLDLGALAQELWTRLVALGITFGVQLELIVHPDAPDVWWLVQVRPSPNQVRHNGVMLSPLPGTLVTTPAISGSFSVSQRAGLTTDLSHKWMLTAGAAGVDLANSYFGFFQPEGILVWSHDPNEDFGPAMHQAAFHAGALVQVTRRVITVNTTHGQISPRLNGHNGSDGGSFIALPDAIHAAVVERLSHEPQRMTTISDGLVGQIAFL